MVGLVGWIAFTALLAAGCGAGGGATRGVRLTGVAADAKGGAVVQTDDGRVVYVIGLPSWPEALHGHRVEVHGTLLRRKLIPDPVVSDAGEHSAGAVGDQEVIEGASWREAARP